MMHQGTVSDPPQGLVVVGPLISVRFHINPAEVTARQERGDSIPAPFVGKVMIDTGASGTHVFDSVPQHFGLTPIRFVPVIGVNGKPEDRPVYRMALYMQMWDSGGKTMDVMFTADITGAPGTFEFPGHPEPVIGLLGRDFLAYFDFHYHGPTGKFELVRPEAENQREDGTESENKKKRLRRQARKSRKKNRRK